jgi:hypothetical protein
MRTLLRTTAYIFWQYPILWLPVVLADLIAFSLRVFQGWMTQTIAQNLVAGHSVLSNTPEPISTLPMAWTVVFGATRFLVEFVNLCLYAAAMIAISTLIRALLAQTKFSWRHILFAVRQLRVQVLLFSLQVFGMLVVALFLDTELAMYLPRLRFLSMFSTVSASRGEGLAIAAILFASVAWLIAPAALALLRPRQSPPNDARSRWQARNIAAISVLASVAIYFLASVAEPSFALLLRTSIGIQLFWAVGSAASALPYIPLFIALDLIANPESPLFTPETSPDPLPSQPQSPPESTAA